MFMAVLMQGNKQAVPEMNYAEEGEDQEGLQK
jgi:hypothetical protein